MDTLLRRSGKSFKANRAQSLTLIFVTTVSYLSHFTLLMLMMQESKFLQHTRKSLFNRKYSPFNTLFNDYFVEEIKLLDPKTKLPQILLCIAQFLGLSIGFGFVLLWKQNLSPRLCLILSCFSQILLNLLGAFTPFYWTFLINRLLLGMAFSACTWSIQCLAIDWSTLKNGYWLLLHANGFQFLSIIFGCAVQFAAKTQVANSWRLILLIQTVLLSISLFLVIIFVRESPKFLLENNRSNEFIALGRQFARQIQYKSILTDKDFFKEEDRLIANNNGQTKGQQFQLVFCFVVISSIVFRMQLTTVTKSLHYDLLMLAVTQLFSYLFSLPIHQKSKDIFVGISVFGLLLSLLHLIVPAGPPQLIIVQLGRLFSNLCFILLYLTLLSVRPSVYSNFQTTKSRIVKLRLIIVTIGQLMANLLGNTMVLLAIMSFTNLQQHFIFPSKSSIFNTGVFCAFGYFLIIVSSLLSTCFCGQTSFNRSNKPMVIVDEEEVEELQSIDEDDELNISEYLDYESPQAEDKNKLFPPHSTLLSELKQNRQFLRQKSTHEVEIELGSNDKIDIEI